MIWPFCPLDNMLEGMEWRTNTLRAFSAEQRIRLRDTPVRTFSHQYAWTPRQYEKARAFFRDQHPGLFDLPDWGLAHRVTVDQGDSFIAFDNRYPTLDIGDSVALIQSCEQYQELTISGSNAGGITLSFPVTEDYENAALVLLVQAHASEGLGVSRSVQPIRSAQLEWITHDTTDYADDGDFQQHRGLPVLAQAACVGESALTETLSKPFDSVDNGIATPYRDTLQEQFTQRLGAAWQPAERSEAYALRQWLYWLKGSQRAFWLPDFNSGLQLIGNVTSGSSSITIRYVGFAGGYVTGDLFLRTTSGTVYTFQVTDSEADTDLATETLTLSAPAGATVGAAQVDQLCLMFCVTIAGNRVEWVHRNVVGPKVVTDCAEVPVP